jgi:uncharacterized protein involved in tellurium resistance
MALIRVCTVLPLMLFVNQGNMQDIMRNKRIVSYEIPYVQFMNDPRMKELKTAEWLSIGQADLKMINL